MPNKIITRFAPSPTGQLHIGGVRTALFNWLYAKHMGGKMLLRIEDTDQERSSKEATQEILDGLSWLGLNWDGEPVSQHQRAHRHREIAQELLKRGQAYFCYTSAKELEDMREKARLEGRPPRYDRRWRESRESPPKDVLPSIRIKAPLEGEIRLNDLVQGEIRFPAKDIDDFIILRSDGSPTYMHAVVVDDHDMEVSHIIRGDDHLTNAARQIILYRAMGWEPPAMAHIPLVHGPDGAKLSKRHGAMGVNAYRSMGYLPEALLNYLARLGWSHGDTEIMSLASMIEWFDICDVNRSAARFDFLKLESLNATHLRETNDEKLLSLLKDSLTFLPQGKDLTAKLDNTLEKKFILAFPCLKQRSRTLCDLIEMSSWLFAARPLSLESDLKSFLHENRIQKIICSSYDFLSKLDDPWSVETIESTLRNLAEKESLKLGDIAQPLRIAVTGKKISPGLFDVLFFLGKEESLARLHDHILSLKERDS